MNRLIRILASIATMAAVAVVLPSCSDDKSYTELLNTESQNVNTFLATTR